MEIKGYRIVEQIHKGNKSRVFRAVREEDNSSVIIKTLVQDHPSAHQIDKFRHQYDILKNCSIPGVIGGRKYTGHDTVPSIIMEDIGGISLRAFLQGKKAAVDTFLELAVKIAAILENIHNNHIIHKDIKPDNIIVTPDLQDVRIIDFSISTRLSSQNPEMAGENQLEGTLAYISPEQTGRMNRPVDYRTDFYSLGITFYEMLTGAVPFSADDALGLIHLHIAFTPGSPHEIDAGIPLQVSRIIMRLLEKNAEKRYRSAGGLKRDLELCKQQYAASQEVELFDLARFDTSDKFQLSCKLYGRDEQIRLLLDTFDKAAAGGRHMLLVSGYPGIGKSALIREIYKPNVKHRGFFISGKYDQFDRNVPFSGIIQAFDQLLHILLTYGDRQIGRWKKKILAALGENAQVIIDVIPSLELVIGAGQPVPKLPPMETKNRFKILFQRFTAVFTRQKQPLTIFLDDLQWADRDSLSLMKTLIAGKDTAGLLILGAYRENETSFTANLPQLLSEIEMEGVQVKILKLQPLEVDHIATLICDSFECSHPDSLALASLVHQKTGGNPFFIGEFLENLYSRKLLFFDRESRWGWDIEAIRAQYVTENVVSLLFSKISGLQGRALELLKIASCMGNGFQISDLTCVCGKEPGQVEEELLLVMEKGFLFLQKEKYFFSHDKVQEAVYSQIPEQDKKALHHKIGHLELKRCSGRELEARIFYIVDQLNAGYESLAGEKEKEELASLNLTAGRRAIESTAYGPALKYFTCALGCVRDTWWQSHYELTRQLYTYGAEAAFFNADYRLMEERISCALEQVTIAAHRAILYEIRIMAYASQANHLKAIEQGRIILSELGVHIPAHPGRSHIMTGYFKTRLVLRGKSMETLQNLAPVENKNILSASRILTSLGTSFYYAQPKMLPVSVFKMMRLTVKYGHTPYSPYIFSAYGFIIAGVMHKVDEGCRFGELALQLASSLEGKQHIGKVILIYYHLTRHWQYHVKEIFSPLAEGYERALEMGDLEYAGICLYSFLADSAVTERQCEKCYNEGKKYLALSKKLHHEKGVNSIKRNLQYYSNLIGKNSANHSRLKGKWYDEDEVLPVFREKNSHTDLSMVALFDLILCCLFGKYEKALEHAAECRKYLIALQGLILVPAFYFYHSLALLAVCPAAAGVKGLVNIRKARANQKKMRCFAKNAPCNHLHKYYLVEAELARVKGNKQRAMDYYEKAIDTAGQNEYINEQAIAYECAARFYLEQNKQRIGALYLAESLYCFKRWGAFEKVRHLEMSYPEILEPKKGRPKKSTTSVTLDTTTGEGLDINTILKASRALSGEIELPRLLKKMMRIVIENAGAQRGLLILEKEGRYYIEAEATLQEEEIEVMQQLPADTYRGFSRAVFNYVLHSKVSFVTGEALDDQMSSQDEYIKENQVKSLLCFPIIHQSKLLALVYLENNLSTNVFTAARLELLKALSAQIIISIENARLYNGLEQQVNERTVQLLSAHKKLEHSHEELLRANRKIMDSLGYARHIQTSILPGEQEFGRALEDNFILWKPLDIVGGDFYWFKKTESAFFLAVLDCTGHGIPGAFMSMIGRSGLDHIVTHLCNDNPALILQELNKLIKKMLNQHETGSLTDDGMDAALILVEPGKKRLVYAGARIPLYYCWNSMCLEILPDKQSLGYSSSEADYTYTNHTLDITGDEVFFLTTDGFIDQSGGKKGFSFGRKRFKTLVLNNYKKPMQQQQDILESALSDYRQQTPQLDDITVIGFIPRI